MALREGETYHRIILGNVQLNQDEPHIAIVDGELIATSRTMLFSGPIPAEGYNFHDIFRLGSLLRVRGPWLADQLNRPEFNGIAGRYVAELAVLNTIDINVVAGAIINNALARGIIRPRPRALTLTELTVPDEEVCVICLSTKSESQNETWVTAQGCASHRFHAGCIRQWTAGTCPTCRAPLS